MCIFIGVIEVSSQIRLEMFIFVCQEMIDIFSSHALVENSLFYKRSTRAGVSELFVLTVTDEDLEFS